MKYIKPKTNCSLCNRLYSFRNNNILKYPKWFNKPVQSFGSKKSQILIVGLAPGLKGANRTGRPFTGDYAGDVLYPLLLKNNLASGKFDKNGSDNLVLKNCRITNSVRCVPPKNKPTNEEINICNAFLTSEINNLRDLKIILTLGRIAHIAVLKSLKLKNSKYTFGHDKVHKVENYIIINSYHCSKYNIFTKRLSINNFNKIIKKTKDYI